MMTARLEVEKPGGEEIPRIHGCRLPPARLLFSSLFFLLQLLNLCIYSYSRLLDAQRPFHLGK